MEANQQKYNSGSGSDTVFSDPYCRMIGNYISHNNVRRIVDIGCGDFRVGERLLTVVDLSEIYYLGIDVVPFLVKDLSSMYGSDVVEFVCFDITRPWPINLRDGDLVLVRQVLQHLSNAQILFFLSMIKANNDANIQVIVTEHQYVGSDLIKNIDKVAGADNRSEFRSGVFLDMPPFSLMTKELLRLKMDKNNDLVSSLLVRGNG